MEKRSTVPGNTMFRLLSWALREASQLAIWVKWMAGPGYSTVPSAVSGSGAGPVEQLAPRHRHDNIVFSEFVFGEQFPVHLADGFADGFVGRQVPSDPRAFLQPAIGPAAGA